MKIVKCNLCKKEFEAKSQGKRTVLYCSIICRNRNIASGRRLYKYPKFLLNCVQCGKPVYAKNMSFDKPNRKYCNKACKASHENKGRIMTIEQKKAISIRNTKHGHSSNKLWKVWSEMVRRCDPVIGNKNYGLRGIKVSSEWIEFKEFEEWSKKSGYSIGLTIERVDVNGDYCKENCTWIPMSEQSKNRRPSSEWNYKNNKLT